jgi:hypothetical protein
MAAIINASNAGAGGLVTSGDASGTLQLQGGGNTGVSINSSGVPTLTTGAILNTPASVSLTNATNFLSVNDITVFLGVNTLIGATTTALINTGSIGASGQKWEITGVALVGSTTNPTTAGVAIYNGSTWVASGGGVATYANWPVTGICRAVVTLSAATTFTLYGTGNEANCYAFYAGYGGVGSVTGGTYITARRLT